MPQLAISVAGAALGNALAPAGFAFLGLSGASIGWAIGSAVGAQLFGPNVGGGNIEGPRLEDARITGSGYGQAITRLWGTASMAGNIIDASEIREIATSQEVGGGGGGGSDFFGGGAQGQTVTTYSYEADIAVLLCEGEIDGLLQIYANEQLIYDATPTSNIVQPDWLAFQLYKGTEDQEPDTTLEAIHGAGNVPAYKGVAYVVFKSFQLGTNGVVGNFRFVVVKNGSDSTPETEVDLPGPVNYLVYSPRAQLIVFPIDYALPATSGESSTALVAIDPYTKEIAWETSITNGDEEYYRTSPVLTPRPDYFTIGTQADAPAGTEATAICVAQRGFPLKDGHLKFYDAITGAIISELPCADFLSGCFLAPLRRRSINMIQLSIQSPPIVSLLTLTGAGQYTITTIDPPTGYTWVESTIESNYLYSPDTRVAVAAKKSSNNDPAVVLVNPMLESTSTYDFSSDLTAVEGIAWDEVRGHWWVIGMLSGTAKDGPAVYKFEIDGTITTYNMATLYDITDLISTADGYPLIEVDDLLGDIWWMSSTGKAYRWNPDTGEEPEVFSGGSNAGGVAYHRGTRTVWGANEEGAGAYGLRTVGLSSTDTTLQTVVEDLCEDTELESADYTAAALSSTAVRGFVIARQMSRRDAIQSLRQAYLFDFVPRDAVLTAVLRGGAPSATLGEDDLGAHVFGSEPIPTVTIRTVPESSLPQQVDLTYLSASQNYEPVTQTARRLASAGGTKLNVNIPIVLTEEEGAQLADTLLHLQHIGAEIYEGAAMPSQADDCQPAEVITVSAEGRTLTWRIETASIVDGGIVELRGQREDASTYEAFTVGGDLRDRARTVPVVGPTIFWPLDLPLLRNSENDAGIYAAFGSYTPEWPGAIIYQSTDGETYNQLITTTQHGSMSFMLNVVDDWTAGRQFDPTTVINVRAINTTFQSLTWENAVSGGNVAAWGQPGRWEIVSFTTAEQQADGTWNISGLGRGGRDTIEYADNHLVGDQFVLLSANNIARIAWDASEYNIDRQIKAASVGTFVADAVPLAVTSSAIALRPFAPCRLHASKSGTTWTLEWMRQERTITAAFQQPIMSEETESYQIRILDSESEILNTYTATTNQLEYTSAQQTTDYGDEVNIVYFQVAQVSAVVGAGRWSDINAVGLIYPLSDASGSASAYVSSGDYNAGNQASNAFDDVPSTQWQSNTNHNAGPWIGAQWASAKKVEKITIKQVENLGSNQSYSNSIDIDYSDNGSTWTTADSVTLAQDNTVQAFDIPSSGSHTYWRLKSTSSDFFTNSRWSVQEIEFQTELIL